MRRPRPLLWTPLSAPRRTKWTLLGAPAATPPPYKLQELLPRSCGLITTFDRHHSRQASFCLINFAAGHMRLPCSFQTVRHIMYIYRYLHEPRRKGHKCNPQYAWRMRALQSRHKMRCIGYNKGQSVCHIQRQVPAWPRHGAAQCHPQCCHCPAAHCCCARTPTAPRPPPCTACACPRRRRPRCAASPGRPRAWAGTRPRSLHGQAARNPPYAVAHVTSERAAGVQPLLCTVDIL